jgi:hypothetical protein
MAIFGSIALWPISQSQFFKQNFTKIGSEKPFHARLLL